MKIKYLLPSVLLMSAAAAYGRPADPGLQQLVNPDGTTVSAYFYGDELFHYVANAEDGTLLDKDAKGFWKPVLRAGRVMKNVESDLSLLRAELPIESEITAARNRVPARMPDLTSNGKTTFPTMGEVHSPVVLIEYADTPYVVPNVKEQYERMLNQEGYSGYNGRGSARDYFLATSNGKFSPTFDVYGPVKVSHNKAYYVGAGTGLPGEGTNAYFGYAIKEALEILYSQGVDFTQYDYDKNGKVDNIFFYYSGKGQADSQDKEAVWPHQSTWAKYESFIKEPPQIGDILFDCYACSCELKGNSPLSGPNIIMDGIGAFTHEFCHVLGLADLYDTMGNKKTKVPGIWNNMSAGSYNMNSTCPPLMSAWEMWQCNWIELEEAELSSHHEIPALGTSETNRAIKIRIDRDGPTISYWTNEYFIVEARSSNNTWDAGLPGEGILIWHVNFNRLNWMYNDVNNSSRQSYEIMNIPDNSTVYVPYPSDEINGVYPGMDGQLKPKNKSTRFNGFVTDMVYDSETAIANFDYGTMSERPDQVTVLHDNPTRGNSRSVILEWDAVDDPDADFLLTVQRIDSRGNVMNVNGLNETNVGKVTTYTLSNLTSASMDQTFKVYVRVAKKTPGGLTTIPCIETSNVIEFVPNSLPSGVEDIEILASEIIAGKGFISAPEGARIYNLSGTATGSDNLPAGIYIVRLGSKSVKVNVR